MSLLEVYIAATIAVMAGILVHFALWRLRYQDSIFVDFSMVELWSLQELRSDNPAPVWRGRTRKRGDRLFHEGLAGPYTVYEWGITAPVPRFRTQTIYSEMYGLPEWPMADLKKRFISYESVRVVYPVNLEDATIAGGTGTGYVRALQLETEDQDVALLYHPDRNAELGDALQRMLTPGWDVVYDESDLLEGKLSTVRVGLPWEAGREMKLAQGDIYKPRSVRDRHGRQVTPYPASQAA